MTISRLASSLRALRRPLRWQHQRTSHPRPVSTFNRGQIGRSPSNHSGLTRFPACPLLAAVARERLGPDHQPVIPSGSSRTRWFSPSPTMRGRIGAQGSGKRCLHDSVRMPNLLRDSSCRTVGKTRPSSSLLWRSKASFGENQSTSTISCPSASGFECEGASPT